jgi:hypothetical protein
MDRSQLVFEWSPILVEGAESDGETMLHYQFGTSVRIEYEYPEDDDSYNGCHSDTADAEKEDCSDGECLSYPVKLQRQQRRARLCGLHCYISHAGADAGAASASMLVDPCLFGTLRWIAAAFATILACAVSGVLSAFNNRISALANAIGILPQHDEEWDDAPMDKFWLKKICGMVCFASLVMVGIGCFAGTLVQGSFTNGISNIWLLAENYDNDLPFRVLGVFVLSVMSGCLLALNYPLRSALLCGI